MSTANVIAVTASIVALLGVIVTAWGYFHNASEQRKLELLKSKSDAYADFLGTLEILLPATSNETLQDNEKIKILNKTLSGMLLKAPSCVVLEINSRIFGDDRTKKISLNRQVIKQLQLILHNDVNGQLKCVDGTLKESDFPHFPFQ